MFLRGSGRISQGFLPRTFCVLAVFGSVYCSESKSNSSAHVRAPAITTVEGRQSLSTRDSTYAIGRPFFRLDVERASHPLFSFLVYDNGGVHFLFLRQHNPSVESLFAAGDDVERLARLKYTALTKRARFDSADFSSVESIVRANSKLFQKSSEGEEDGSRFIMDFQDQGKEPLSCSWQEPLSKQRAAFIKKFLDLSFREFANDTVLMFRQAVFESTPSLNQFK